MSPPAVVAVMTLWDRMLVGTDTLVLPPSVCAVALYTVFPFGTTIVTSPPSVLTCTLVGTAVNTIVMSPPDVLALTWAAVTPLASMSPPSVCSVRLPATWLAVTSPPLVVMLTGPVMPSAVTLPPSVDTDTGVLPGTFTVALRPQSPNGIGQPYPKLATPALNRSVTCGRTRL